MSTGSYDHARFKNEGIAIPPLTVHASPGDTWPETPIRLTVRSAGDANAALRALGTDPVARVEAKRVVSGTPTGSWIDISTTNGFLVTADEGELETFDLRVVILARVGGFVRRLGRLCVVTSRAGGW